ncbi:hypothetical protein IGK47_000740 [Enterococcus sp. AZ007]
MGFLIDEVEYLKFIQGMFWFSVFFELYLILLILYTWYNAKSDSDKMILRLYVTISIFNLIAISLHLRTLILQMELLRRNYEVKKCILQKTNYGLLHS